MLRKRERSVTAADKAPALAGALGALMSAITYGRPIVWPKGHFYEASGGVGFARNYKAAAAGLTVGAGGQVARFQNANGVILELVGAQLGLAVSLGSAGMTIALQTQ